MSKTAVNAKIKVDIWLLSRQICLSSYWINSNQALVLMRCFLFFDAHADQKSLIRLGAARFGLEWFNHFEQAFKALHQLAIAAAVE